MMTGHRIITPIITLVLSLLFCMFVFVFEHYSRVSALETINRHARVISNNLWNYNAEGASEYLRLAAASHNYENLIVTDHSGVVFFKRTLPIPSWPDRILIRLYLMPKVDLLAHVEHKENIIGWVEASWRPRTIYTYMYVLAFLVLVIVVLHLYLRTLQAKVVLEDRVRERTVELMEINASLQQEISERRKADEERTLLQAQLRQAHKMEAIGTLAGGVAHDFNNILQSINGYAQILNMNREEGDPEHSKILAIQKACERSAQLVQQLLLFSRKVEAERRPVDLNREVEQARRILERTIPKMIDIEVHLGGGLRAVNADPVQIERILLNLGTNAVDAMPDGGKLTIKTEQATLGQEFAHQHLGAKAGDYALLTVSDTGHGMEKNIVEHIFEPFYTTKDIGRGTGLGLASVYGIVKNHGGYIICHSEAGQGTTFSIYLPTIGHPDISAKKEVDDKPRVRGTETILFVDDEASIRDVASQALADHGYKVLTASGGEEALEIYPGKDDEIDLVVLDIGMPGMGGHQCLRELLRIDPAVKVLIASGYSIDGQAKKTMEAGAVGFIGKPYRLTALLEKVRDVLTRDAPPLD